MTKIRLFNSHNYKFMQFDDNEIPDYAILSHRWRGNNEVTNEEMEIKNRNDNIDKPGFQKVLAACAKARKDRIDWLWVDSCCINKRDLPEISASINSMFRWYQCSAVCYAYLDDIARGSNANEILKSEWFERGWTLQELIAPSKLIFYAVDWSEIGTKGDLSADIAKHLGISANALKGDSVDAFSVAQRMSWVSRRMTTVPEDIVYCLLGIFGVTMALLYGEGPAKAFLRLQEEILKDSDDESLFAWTSSTRMSLYGALADSPALFAHSFDIVKCRPWRMRSPTVMTNRGLQVTAPLAFLQRDRSNAQPDLLLQCRREHDYENVLAIPLRRTSLPKHEEYTRREGALLQVPVRDWRKTRIKKIYIRKSNSVYRSISTASINQIWLRSMLSDSTEYELVSVMPSGVWNTDKRLLTMQNNLSIDHQAIEVASLVFRAPGSGLLYIRFGLERQPLHTLKVLGRNIKVLMEVVMDFAIDPASFHPSEPPTKAYAAPKQLEKKTPKRSLLASPGAVISAVIELPERNAWSIINRMRAMIDLPALKTFNKTLESFTVGSAFVRSFSSDLRQRIAQAAAQSPHQVVPWCDIAFSDSDKIFEKWASMAAPSKKPYACMRVDESVLTVSIAQSTVMGEVVYVADILLNEQTRHRALALLGGILLLFTLVAFLDYSRNDYTFTIDLALGVANRVFNLRISDDDYGFSVRSKVVLGLIRVLMFIYGISQPLSWRIITSALLLVAIFIFERQFESVKRTTSVGARLASVDETEGDMIMNMARWQDIDLDDST